MTKNVFRSYIGMDKLLLSSDLQNKILYSHYTVNYYL